MHCEEVPSVHNPIGQLTNANAMLADDTPWQAYQFGYQYDDAGNPVEQDKNGLVHSNSFNNLNQNVDSVLGGALTVLGLVNYPNGTVTVNSVQAQITSNLLFAAPGVPFSSGTNFLNTVFTGPYGRSTNSQISVIASEKAYQYDANGNLTNDGYMAYYWNDENRLIVVRNAQTGVLIQKNFYDGLCRRREVVEYSEGKSITNQYVYQNWLVLSVTDGDGSVLETYTHGADLSGKVGGGAGGIGGILSFTRVGIPAFYHYDFNGNVVQVSASNQFQLVTYTYSPFGMVLLKEGEFNSRYQFSSKEYDSLAGLYYYGYRQYNPQTGRWLSRDPSGEKSGGNRYLFIQNNSLGAIDVLGLFGRYTAVLLDWVETGTQLAEVSNSTSVEAGVRPFNDVDDDNCPICRKCKLYREATGSFVPVEKVYLSVTVVYDDSEMTNEDVADTIAEAIGYIGGVAGSAASSVASRIVDTVANEDDLIESHGHLQIGAFYPGSYRLSLGDFWVDEEDCTVSDGACESEDDQINDGYGRDAANYFDALYSRYADFFPIIREPWLFDW